MIALICVIAVVAMISLYDYFNGRSWQQVTSEKRNEAVFEKRNRAYGAYVIRRDYDKRLMLIVAGLAGGIGVLYATTRGGEIEKSAKPVKDLIVVLDFTQEDEKDEVKPEILDQQPASTSSQQYTEFDVFIAGETDEPISLPEPGLPVGTPLPIGGEPGFGPEPPGPPSTGGGGTITPPPTPSGPETYVDEVAVYPGGNPAMRTFIGNNLKYPQTAAELGIQGKCFLRFVVAMDGDISDVTVMRGVPDCPECDEEAKRVIKLMPRWKPAKKNGKTVDSYFNIPIAFELRDN